ncbi:MAG: hypothetical protein Tsb002_36090 [Wenzhouxiangellaceae bacterium]
MIFVTQLSLKKPVIMRLSEVTRCHRHGFGLTIDEACHSGAMMARHAAVAGAAECTAAAIRGMLAERAINL